MIARVKRRLHRRLESCLGEGKDKKRATVAVALKVIYQAEVLSVLAL